MVEADDAAGDVAARRVVVGADQRPDAGVGPQDAGGGEGRGHLGALGDQERDFIGRNGHIVTFFERNARRGRPDDADRVARHQDIGIRRFSAAVDDQIVHPVGEDQQGAFGGIHADVDAGQVRDGASPDAAGVDRDRCVEIFFFAGDLVPGMDAPDRVAFPDEPGDFRMQPDLAAVKLGIQHIGRTKAERVHAAVRHADGADQVRIDRRLQPPGQVRIDDFSADARLPAGVHEGLLVTQVIFRQGDEQAVGLFDAVRRDPAQDPVLFDTFFGGFRIVHGIACP